MLFFRFLIFTTLFFIQSAYANYAVVVSSKSNLTNISKSDISKIFLSKTKDLPNGKKALTVELDQNKSQLEFYKKISRKSKRQLKKYWATIIFTGRGQPPKKLNSVDDIIAFIKKNVNAISYIPIQDVTDDLKVLLVLN